MQTHSMVHIENYIERLQASLKKIDKQEVYKVSLELRRVWDEKKCVFICGNGGSAANAMHLANDLIYGIGTGGSKQYQGIKVEALTSNVGIVTCLGNDVGYEHIFSRQVATKSEAGDILILLSGSGRSKNVVNALREAKVRGVKTIAFTGFSGGECKQEADISIHVGVNDMQIAEDIQLIVGHMCMQWLKANKPAHLEIVDG